jgi:uncharacterized protein (DUF849 family)
MDAGKQDPASNRRLVSRVAGLAGALGRRIATPVEARELLGLQQRELTAR